VRFGDRWRARQDWVLRGFRQFDAPASFFVTYNRVLHGSDIPPFDCGGVVNCLMNAAWSRGLGCVINSQGSCSRGWCGRRRGFRRGGDPDLRGDRGTG